MEIALHGFNHKNNANSEFKNVDINLQYEMIKSGKEFLDSVFATRIVTFIPPFNSYDVVTLKVLSSLGFRIISADIYGIGNYNKILYLPNTYDGMYDLKKIITNNLYKNVILVVMFHKYNITGYPYEYNVKTNSFSEVNEILKWINSTGVNCYTYSQLIESGENLNSNRYILNAKYFNGIITKRMDFEKVYVPAYYIFFKLSDILFWIVYYLIIFIILVKPLNSVIKIGFPYYLTPVIIIMSVFLIALLLYRKFTDKFLLLINGTISSICAFLYLLFK